MTNERKVLIYGASGYTGKIIAESLAERGISFYMSGRSEARLQEAKAIVEERHGKPIDAELAPASNTVEELLPWFEKVDIVINVAGPFMQVAWPIVEAAYQAGCHYLDTTGEQDWTIAIADKYGKAFEDKGLLLAPACSYMWTAGALAAEVVLETEGVDSIDLLYQIDNALPSEASTKSFLRMITNDQFKLVNNEYQPWPVDTVADVVVPYRAQVIHAFPWGGACEPVWLKSDDRVRNCQVLTAFGEHLVEPLKDIIRKYQEAEAKGLSQEEHENWTNAVGDQMATGEPQKDDKTIGRSVIICGGQGQQVTTQFVMSLSAPYCWTGEISAECALHILEGKLLKSGFQPPAKAFNHRELLQRFHELGFCNFPD